MKGIALGIVLVAAAVAGCGGGAPAPDATVTVTARESPPPESPPPAPTPTGAPPAAGRKALPDVVGMNLQEAQDTMQAAGFFVLNDKDATGKNRFQVNDRNWVVTRQEPPAGEEVPPETPVTLWAKKIGE
ncbi:PASTA domain-containing protein [Bailinhaonella thermotolerans]|uniref:PASTA domain-containing protein n=1 Tax=Bailinhaonella thermotolerans TaxID=1070861 RepID=A0A3A4AW37_9ACTN|nr:PASTA domain-containing protein [Bailinhaonella thermotolerans]RJL34095.1 PASTA domain-containing protein [Bailinhaonella thermotolerans]